MVVSLILWYLLVLSVQIASALATTPSIYPWYASLEKASWNPPGWVFGPVWTLLYIMMAVSVWLISQTKTTRIKHAFSYTLFVVQLFLNGLWSFLFFKFHQVGWALLDLGLLIFFIAVMGHVFFRMRKAAGLLLLPYLFWCIYAFTLNAAIWWLN